MGKKFVLISIKCDISSYRALIYHRGIPVNISVNFSMLGDSISINKFVAILLKKLVKPSNIAILGANLHKNGVNIDHVQLSESSYFIKMLFILAE